MNLRYMITGIAASLLLLVVLGVARLFTIESQVPDLEIREIETVIFEPPPPPLPPMEEPPPDAPPPPSPPALTSVSSLPDPGRVPIPQAQVPMDITAPVENFFTDLAPASLPLAPEAARPRRAPRLSTPSLKPAPLRRPTSPPISKSHYNTNELDATPRLLRHGSTTFPASLSRQGLNRGTVVFEVELSPTGSVSIRRVVSSSHADLVAPARRVASGARFTPPKKNGQPVKAIMQWPIIIEK